MGTLLAGKHGLIMGVANEKSIAWGVAQACAGAGAQLAFTYQNDTLKKRLLPLAQTLGSDFLLPCDVSAPENMDAVFEAVKTRWGQLDFLLHSIAFSDKNQLKGNYISTTPENFQMTLNISCYSLTAAAQRAVPLMKEGGSIVTMTYYGAQKVIPHYNVMGVAKAALEASVRYLAADVGKDGIRVNGISAGPIRTLASAGIGDFRYILNWNEDNSPMRRTVKTSEVAQAALYLFSDMSTATTGEILHVDCGYHTVGMLAEEGKAGQTIKEMYTR